jgi:hypothetical protein
MGSYCTLEESETQINENPGEKLVTTKSFLGDILDKLAEKFKLIRLMCMVAFYHPTNQEIKVRT